MEKEFTSKYNLPNRKNFKLTEPQHDIVDFLLKKDFGMNCAQTGIGKTFSTLVAAVHKILERWEDDIHYILLLPLSAIKAFEDELNNLELPYSIYTRDRVRAMKDARFHIFNYSTLPREVIKRDRRKNIIGIGTNKYFETLKKLKREHPNLWLIADEAHYLQDETTIQYLFVREVNPVFIGSWFLTATPILNNAEGLFYMTELISPGFFGNLLQFKYNYQILEEVIREEYDRRLKRKIPVRNLEVKGYKNMDQLALKFDEIAIIRGREYDIDFIYKSTTLNPEWEEYYKLAADGLLSGKEVETKNKKKVKQVVDFGARLHDLQRVVSNSHIEFRQFGADSVTNKEVLLFDTIKEVVERGEAQLIYFTYRETLDRVKEVLEIVKDHYGVNNIYEVHGDIPLKTRKKVEKLIGPGDVVLFTSAGTESINLQRANNLIFYEIPFPLREFIQACGRITRTDTTFDKFRVYVLETENTIDTYKKNRLVANSELIRNILGNSNILPTGLLQVSLDDVNSMKNELLWRR